MNISMNIDCTPEEARRFMGLPDLTPLHDVYLDKMKQAMTEGVTPDMIEQLTRAWSPMGDAGMTAWKALFDTMSVATPSK